MRNPFSDIRPVQERMEISRHPTKGEQVDHILKRLNQLGWRLTLYTDLNGSYVAKFDRSDDEMIYAKSHTHLLQAILKAASSILAQGLSLEPQSAEG